MISTAGLLLGLTAGLLTAIATTLAAGSNPTTIGQSLTIPLLILIIGLPLAGWLTGTLFGTLTNHRHTPSTPPRH